MGKFSQPMRSCSCAAPIVVGSAEGQNRRAWWEERMGLKQEQMEECISRRLEPGGELRRDKAKAADIKGSWQEITCQVVLGLWPQHGHRSLSHSFCLNIMWPMATSAPERICHASHEGTRANVHGPCDKSRAQPSAQLAPPVQSVGDPDVAGEVVAPPDVMGVVAHPSSGSGDVAAGKSGLPPPPMIEQQPALEQHGGGIAGNVDPPSGMNFPIVPREGVAGSGIVGGPAASNQIHPPGNNDAAIPPTIGRSVF